MHSGHSDSYSIGMEEPAERLTSELLEFLSEAPEFVCVAGRRFHRFAKGDFRLRRLQSALEFASGPVRLRLQYNAWRRSTHRFTLQGRGPVILLKPSRRNELWLRRQQFRWSCELQIERHWKLARSTLVLSPGGGASFLYMLLQRGGEWFVAVATGHEETASAEAVLSHLFAFWRRVEFSGMRRVRRGLLFLSPELAEGVCRLLCDVRSAVQIYSLPRFARVALKRPAPLLLLWPSQAARQELQALREQFSFPEAVHAVIRSGSHCSFEYLGIPFAVFQADLGAWKFPLREDALLPGGEAARRAVREEYHRVRERRRPHARLRQDPLYQMHAERWLESLILQDPKRLDPDLRSSPVYSQVPAYVTRRRVIDLVAVTEGGRLVVIEVKVQRAMDLLFQGLSYWRIVRQAQRQDAFHRNGYFPGVELSRLPPLLYCVTPLLLLHPEVRHLARRVCHRAEAYLIGINNDWRRGIQVLRKERLV